MAGPNGVNFRGVPLHISLGKTHPNGSPTTRNTIPCCSVPTRISFKLEYQFIWWSVTGIFLI